METAIVKFARKVRECPDDRIALSRLMEAVRAEGQAAAWATLAEWWVSALSGRPEPGELLAALYCRAAEHAPPEVACNLARAALDLRPLCNEALLLLEEHLPASEQRELCERYRTFLRDAPFQRASPGIRVRLIDRLLEAGRYDEAAEQVRMLPPRSAMREAVQDMERACEVRPEVAPPNPVKPKTADLTLMLEETDIEVLWHDDSADERPGRTSDIRALAPSPHTPQLTHPARPSTKSRS